jgi:hypothetical protein
MIGMWKAYADTFLIVAGVAMLVSFGLPLMIVPMSWARLFRWEVPQSRSLVIFLARSMGVLISILAVFAFKVTASPAAKPFFFDLMLWIFGGMLILHIYGAVRKSQPVTENLEIIVWIALSLVALAFYPV